MASTAQILQFSQRQTQTLSPRLQHAVRLLQMSSLEFAQTLAETLDRNPFLDGEDGDEGDDGALPSSLASLTAPASSEAEPEQPLTTAAVETLDDAASAHERVGEAETGLDEAPGWADGVPTGPRSDSGDFSPLDLLPTQTTLTAYLHSQLNVLPLGLRDMALAKAVVESLDDDGYLRVDPFELLETAELEPPAEEDEMLIAVRRVQSLDPAGVAARNLQECLLLQLGRITDPRVRQVARSILQDHMKLLAAHDSSGLARQLGVTPAEAEEACAQIRRFDPRPGSRFAASQIQYVVPDVLARRQGKRWVAMLNPSVVPRVRLNQNVVELYMRHRGTACPVLASHLQEARWTLRNVEQRFCTIVSVAQAILDRQRHFLEYGEIAMKPLGLREIAAEVGVHESTVSRVTSNKFMSTPAGVFELKRFFSRAMVMPSGNACSGTAIRGLVKDIIESETPDHPLSDAEITKMLCQQGLTVARRTVTKYRQALRIEPVARRRAVAG